MLPKVEENLSDKGQLRTLTQLILDFSEVRRINFPVYRSQRWLCSLGDSAIFTSPRDGPVRVSCDPRVVSPPLSTSLQLFYPT